MQSLAFTKDSTASDSQVIHGRPVAAVNDHSSYSMYPLMTQPPFTSGTPYLLDRGPHASQIAQLAPMAPMFPVISQMYRAPPSPALTVRNDFSPSRSASGYARMDARRQNASRVTRSPYHSAASHHNHVDIGRIRDGIDVRTTVSKPGLFYVSLILTRLDHASKYPEQGRSSNAEAHHR